MLEALAYEEKEVLLQKLHPLVLMLVLAVLFFQALLFNNPVVLLAVFIVTILLVMVSDAFDKCELYLAGGLWMALLLILVNALAVHSGKTVIFHGPYIPILGRLDICLEAICYGADMGMRLLIILLVFGLYNAMMHPDKIMNLFSRPAFKSALVLSLTTRMLPAVVRDLGAAMEAQQMRGVDFNSGTIWQRLKKYSWLLNIVLISSLEGSLQTAEAIQARAFGSGPRTSYQRFKLRPRDYICSLAVILSALFSIYGKIKGYGDYAFYPQMGAQVGNNLIFIWLPATMLSYWLIVIMAWGWNHCLAWKSKI